MMGCSADTYRMKVEEHGHEISGQRSAQGGYQGRGRGVGVG